MMSGELTIIKSPVQTTNKNWLNYEQINQENWLLYRLPHLPETLSSGWVLRFFLHPANNSQNYPDTTHKALKDGRDMAIRANAKTTKMPRGITLGLMSVNFPPSK